MTRQVQIKQLKHPLKQQQKGRQDQLYQTKRLMNYVAQSILSSNNTQNEQVLNDRIKKYMSDNQKLIIPDSFALYLYDHLESKYQTVVLQAGRNMNVTEQSIKLWRQRLQEQQDPQEQERQPLENQDETIQAQQFAIIIDPNQIAM